MRILVVRNTSTTGVRAFGQVGREWEPESVSVSVAESLRGDGHVVAVAEGDARLLDTIDRFMPPSADAAVTGMVFNLSRGIQGDVPRSHVPAILEMAGVPYTGPGPLAHALTFDTAACRALLRQSGLPTTRSELLRWRGDEVSALRFPLLVTPRYCRGEDISRLALNRSGLADAYEAVTGGDEEEALVEEYADSREVSACLLGNGDDLELLPLVQRHERDPQDGGRVLRYAASTLVMRVGAMAATAFRACRCQDYARVIFRVDPHRRPLVVGVDAMPRLASGSIFVRAAVAAGYEHRRLVAAILDAAHRRYFGVAAPRFEISARIDDDTLAPLHPADPNQ